MVWNDLALRTDFFLIHNPLIEMFGFLLELLVLFGWACIAVQLLLSGRMCVVLVADAVLIFVCSVLCSCSRSVKGPQQWQQAHLLHDYRQGCCNWGERPPTYTAIRFNSHADTAHTVSCLSQLCRPVTCHMASASLKSVFVWMVSL